MLDVRTSKLGLGDCPLMDIDGAGYVWRSWVCFRRAIMSHW